MERLQCLRLHSRESFDGGPSLVVTFSFANELGEPLECS